jgi:hypothetical protein
VGGVFRSDEVKEEAKFYGGEGEKEGWRKEAPPLGSLLSLGPVQTKAESVGFTESGPMLGAEHFIEPVCPIYTPPSEGVFADYAILPSTETPAQFGQGYPDHPPPPLVLSSVGKIQESEFLPPPPVQPTISQLSVPNELTQMSENDLISYINPSCFDQGLYLF